jgi:anaerobic magnesium-protoporphyrin IX monomethyl ester cyclase
MKPPVCLIVPPSIFLLDERVFMNLGILKVASSLERAGYGVEMLDLSGIENYREAVADHASRSEAKVFGLTATTPQLPATIEVRNTIRSVRPDARIIFGGPHITLVNAASRREVKLGIDGRAQRALQQLDALFDVLVAGDGEDSIFAALSDKPPRLVDADDPRSSLFLTNSRLTELPFPARHLVDVDSYNYAIDGVRALSLIAQLGCPFACGFCGGRESPMLRRVRMRPAENIVAEVIHMYEAYGVKGFMFYDDELNVNPKLVEFMRALAQAARSRGIEWRLRGFIKAELFNDEQAAAMYEAGFRWILSGFESGSPRILRNINKKATIEENTRCVEIARRNGLKVKALMSIGHPGESRETIGETLEWLLQIKPEDFDITIITTYPGTPYYDQASPHPDRENVWVYSINGDRLYSYEVDYTVTADYYKGDPSGGYKSFVYTDSLSPDDLVELRGQVETDVRTALMLPFPTAAPAIRYEHSMGQSGELPSNILRKASKQKAAAAAFGGPFPVFQVRPVASPLGE